MPNNYQLYARILRLVTDYSRECIRDLGRSWPGNERYLHDVTANVIAVDRKLVWC